MTSGQAKTIKARAVAAPSRDGSATASAATRSGLTKTKSLSALWQVGIATPSAVHLGVYYRVDRQSVVDLQAAIFDSGAVYVSANVHAGWEVKPYTGTIKHRTLPVIEASVVGYGGHAFALVGYNEIGFIVQNSWGEKWAARGFAVLPYEDWAVNGTDAWVMGLGAPVQRLQQRQYFVKHNDGIAGNAARSAIIGPAHAKSKTTAETWSEQETYWHTIVTGNDVQIINRLPHVRDEKDNVAWAAYEQPRNGFENTPAAASGASPSTPMAA